MGGQKSSDVKILWDKGHQCHEGSAGHVHLERSLDAKCERLVTQAPPSDPSPSSGRCGERPVITTRFCALFYALLPSIFGIVRVTCVRCDVSEAFKKVRGLRPCEAPRSGVLSACFVAVSCAVGPGVAVHDEVPFYIDVFTIAVLRSGLFM